jgi:hypothetical protein
MSEPCGPSVYLGGGIKAVCDGYQVHLLSNAPVSLDAEQLEKIRELAAKSGMTKTVPNLYEGDEE